MGNLRSERVQKADYSLRNRIGQAMGKKTGF